MSLQTRLAALITAIGADIKSINTQLASLQANSGPWTDQILTTTHNNARTTATEPFVGFAPLANSLYLVEVIGSIQSSVATTGVQTALAGPTSGIMAAAVKITSAASATADKVDHLGLNTFQVATAGLLTPNLYNLQAIVETAGPVGAGNIRLQLKSEANSQVTMRPGSIFRWRTI